MGILGIEADLLGIPHETAAELVTQWKGLVRLYPEAARLWRSIRPDIEGCRLEAFELMGYAGGEMLWNHLRMRVPRDELDRLLADAVADGTHPAGCGTVAALATHEFGHAVEDVVAGQLGDAEWRSLHDRLANCHVSAYTQREPRECFAVAFTALHHGEHGRLTEGAQSAGDLVARTLKTLGMWSPCRSSR